MKKALIFMCCVFSVFVVVAIEPEPNWQEKLDSLKREAESGFKVPKTGDKVSFSLSTGNNFAGKLKKISASSLTIDKDIGDGKTVEISFKAEQLADSSREKFFSDFYALKTAQKQIAGEKADYQARKETEQKIEAEKLALAQAKTTAADKAKQKEPIKALNITDETEQTKMAAAQPAHKLTASEAFAAGGVLGVLGCMGISFILILILPYFIPTVIAFCRGHSSKWAILIVNLLLGWTLLLWIVCLIWSLTGSKQTINITINNTPSATNEPKKFTFKKKV